MDTEKKGNKWPVIAKKAAVAAATAAAAAAVDIGLLNGSLGLFVKALLQNLGAVA